VIPPGNGLAFAMLGKTSEIKKEERDNRRVNIRSTQKGKLKDTAKRRHDVKNEAHSS